MKFKLHLLGGLLLGWGALVALAPITPEDSTYTPTTYKIHELRSVDNSAFKVGEVLRYRLHYGPVNAGGAELKVLPHNEKIEGREVYHIVGTGFSSSSFDSFFRVRDTYESYIDKQGLFPWAFKRRVDEGGYKISQDYEFMQKQGQVKTQESKTYDVPEAVQDMLSAFYFARSFQLDQLHKGDTLEMQCFMDNEIWPLKVRYIGEETIKIKSGKFRCLKFNPIVQQGRVFRSSEDLNVWITNDGNRIPILAKAKLAVGAVKMELTSYRGLANPVAKEK